MKIFLIFTILLFSSILVNAQTKAGSDLTWSELKQVQKAEDDNLMQTQRETLNKLFELQQSNFLLIKQEGTSTVNNLLEIAEKQKLERLELVKTFSDERIKLAQIHSEERKLFYKSNQ